MGNIEWLRLMLPAVKKTPKRPPYIYSDSSIRLHSRKVVISTVILETNLRSTTVHVNCRCSTVTMLIRSNSYATWSASESVVSVQLPLNSTFFCHVEVLSHMVL